MEKSQWVAFDEMENGTETFWTIQVAMVGIAGTEGKTKLPILLHFMEDTLWYLQKLKDTARVQVKTPWRTGRPEGTVVEASKRGDNVTIVEMSPKKLLVYKEFCYYLRDKDVFNFVEDSIDEKNRRWTPSREVLRALGEPYSSWKVEDGPCGIKILVYEFIDGKNRPESQTGWMQVLKQVKVIHSLGFVHGDLLPRNLIFSGSDGNVIDFDLMREQGQPYVSGYNRDFPPYRHSGAGAGKPMKKEHDFWALVQMSKEYFDLPDNWQVENLSGLLSYFEGNQVKLKDTPRSWTSWEAEATGSPARDDIDITVDLPLQAMDI